ncbi:MAG: hypothetical protein Q3X77_07455, partial [Oscillospiraceae bacterium]|nr:hypothetical protein [Oscillospiraceae bacterium]
ILIANSRRARVCLHFATKRRRLSRPQAQNIFNHFSPRPVRGEKYFSQSECRAAKGGEAQSAAHPLSFLRNGLPFLKNEIC